MINTDKKIVFMCGALRSGSSVFHLMLDCHPDIENPGEFDFLFDLVSDDGVVPDIDFYHNWLSMHRIFQSKSLIIDESLDYMDLIASFIDQLIVNSSVLVLNIHRGFQRIPFLFPNAMYIHLIRDPRDVARSSIGMGWAGNVYYGTQHWANSEKGWKQLEAKTSAGQFYQIRFEDLIISPKKILTDVCGFIGVQYSDQMMSYAQSSTYSKPDSSLVNQWKTRLSVKEVQLVEFKVKGLMLDLGYKLSGEPFISIGCVELVWLKISNKVFRFKFALKRYGIRLYFYEYFSRVFRFDSMNKQARMAMNEVNKGLLK